MNLSSKDTPFRILLIDNDINTLISLEELLQKPKREILKVHSGAEALELLQEEEVGLIITDLIMPNMDGFELLEHLAMNKRTVNIYTIIILRRDAHFNDNIVHGLNNGAVDYLVKPISPKIAEAKVQVFEKLYHQRLKLADQTKKVEELLLNILPQRTAKELQIKGNSRPRKYDMASVMFTDFQGFTKRATNLDPEALVAELDWYFRNFDSIVEKHNIEKIKTIGDAYMCAGGIPIRNRSNPIDMVLAGLEICTFMEEAKRIKEERNEEFWDVRIGIHTGPLVAGVVGKIKWAYDVWGNTVNTANRLESAGQPGYVNVSESTYQQIKDFFVCEHRGTVDAKHLGPLDMYFVLGLKPNYSENGEGKVPNTYFRELMSKI